MRITNLPEESPEYRSSREALAQAEIELMAQVEKVAALRRQLPEGPVVEDYQFAEGPADLEAGDEPARVTSLGELSSGPGRPLVIYHLMYGKAQTTPCPMCTCWIDGFNGVAHHLAENVDFAVAAAAELPALRAYGRSRGWHRLRLLSCGDSTFKRDLGSESDDGRQDSEISVFSQGRGRQDPPLLQRASAHVRRDPRARHRPFEPGVEPARPHARRARRLVRVARLRRLRDPPVQRRLNRDLD